MSPAPDLESLAREYGRYHVDAYIFVQEGLRHAAEIHAKLDPAGQAQHLSADELVAGVLALAGQRFGLLAATVLRHWGLRRSEDIGAITFQLIDCGVFGKRPSDRLEDFENGPSFVETCDELVRERLGIA